MWRCHLCVHKGSYFLLLYPTVAEKIGNFPLLTVGWNVCCFLVLEDFKKLLVLYILELIIYIKFNSKWPGWLICFKDISVVLSFNLLTHQAAVFCCLYLPGYGNHQATTLCIKDNRVCFTMFMCILSHVVRYIECHEPFFSCNVMFRNVSCLCFSW